MSAETRIAAAACRVQLRHDFGAVKAGDWLILSMEPPARHHHILHAMCATGISGPAGLSSPIEQAFITSDGRFVDRREALEIATAAGQLIKNPNAKTSPISPPNLFSEDLW